MIVNNTFSVSLMPYARGIDNYEESQQFSYVADQVDVGTPAIRPRSTQSRKFFTLILKMPRDKFDELKLWVANNLISGTQPFYFPSPFNQDELIAVRFPIENNNGNFYKSMEWNYRFVKLTMEFEQLHV